MRLTALITPSPLPRSKATVTRWAAIKRRRKGARITRSAAFYAARNLQNERGRHEEDPPFLLELAHYEWVELALLIAEESPPEENPALVEQPLSQTIYLSELAWPLAYRFPVHRIGPDYLPSVPPEEPTFLLVYRDRGDEVNFLEIGAGAYQLLEALQRGGPIEARDVIGETAFAGDLDEEALTRSHLELLSELAKLSVIGARRATDQMSRSDAPS